MALCATIRLSDDTQETPYEHGPRNYLKERPELAREIENKVRASLGVPLLGVIKNAPAAKKAGAKDAKDAKDAKEANEAE